MKISILCDQQQDSNSNTNEKESITDQINVLYVLIYIGVVLNFSIFFKQNNDLFITVTYFQAPIASMSDSIPTYKYDS